MQKFAYSILLSALILIGQLLITGCGTTQPNFKTLAQADPGWLLAHEDSLLTAFPDSPELTQILVELYLAKGHTAYAAADWSTARENFEHIQILQPRQREARYWAAMSAGQDHFKRGGPNDLWDAIIKFGEAAALDTARAVPHYWLARSYEKKNRDDFELIIESYDKAFEKGLPPELVKEAGDLRAAVLHRKEIYESFWK